MSAPLSTAELCRLLSVEVPSGAPNVSIEGITTLELAGPRDISFVARKNLAQAAATSRAPLLLIPKGFPAPDPRVIGVPDVWSAVLTLLKYFFPGPARESFIHPTALVDDAARLGKDVYLGPYVVIEAEALVGDGTRIGAHGFVGRGAAIGKDALLHERVTLREGCTLGDRVIVHAGAVIGADGFKYEMIGRRLTKMPQVGIVVVEDDVEIGANAAIDRASFAVTRVGARTKIDNLVQIGHNVEIGSDCIIVAQVGIAGSAKVGRGVLLAGQVGIADHSRIGDGAKIGGQAGARGEVAAGAEIVGTPAIDAKEFARLQYVLHRLPELYKKLQPLLKELEKASQ